MTLRIQFSGGTYIGKTCARSADWRWYVRLIFVATGVILGRETIPACDVAAGAAIHTSYPNDGPGSPTINLPMADNIHVHHQWLGGWLVAEGGRAGDGYDRDRASSAT
jgi:hypothetical protein